LKADAERTKFNILLMGCLLLCIFLAATSVCSADDHKEGKKHSREYEHEKVHNVFRGVLGGRDEGNETTGQIAAWSLGAINLTAALSLLIRGIKRFAPLTPELKNSMTKFNSFQKRHLMRFHYYLNPVFIGVAVLHWKLSRCQSTALTEWALVSMCFIAALGIILKFKLAPKTSLRNVYKVHTHPVIFVSLICLLVIGHLVMD